MEGEPGPRSVLLDSTEVGSNNKKVKHGSFRECHCPFILNILIADSTVASREKIVTRKKLLLLSQIINLKSQNI